MSTASDLLQKVEAALSQINVEGWKCEIDRDGNKIDLTDKLQIGVDIDKRVLVITANYEGHTAVIETRLQRDSNDAISIDGVVMNSVLVDEDVMGFEPRVQLETRYTNPNETATEPATGDNKITFNPGGGQHEFRLIKSISLDNTGIFNQISKVLSEGA